MTVLGCPSIAKNTDSKKKQYDYMVIFVVPKRYLTKWRVFRHMSMHAAKTLVPVGLLDGETVNFLTK